MKMRYLLFLAAAIALILVHFPEDAEENQGLEQSHGEEAAESEAAVEETEAEAVTFKLPNGNVLSVDKSRITDVYGWGHLENRWELEEIDAILDSIKGYWELDEYVGFVAPWLYVSDLFDYNPENENDPYYAKLFEQYDEEVRAAEENIPDLFFSVKEKSFGEVPENYIYTSGRFYSPVNIILSLERSADYYPILSERTTISSDFGVEYPVLYVQFFLNNTVENQKADEYRSATIVMTSDDRLLLLIDGAFYSIKRMEQVPE